MRIGLVCPYSWEIPGGVQAHVADLATSLRSRGHTVSVLSPGDEDDVPITDVAALDLTLAGKAVPIPYNGSVARLQFGFVSFARVKRWLADGDFDLVHVHEPGTPSLSLLTCVARKGPLVATFHMATERSRFLLMFDTMLQPHFEKITARIAVSEPARAVVVEHFNTDAVIIPNGVDVSAFRAAAPLAGLPRRGGTIGFIGRYEEPRKGMGVLLAALQRLIPTRPDLRLLVAGVGDADAFRRSLPRELRPHVELLGRVTDAEKAALLTGVDIYCAPNTGGESFGVILLEAMAAGTAIVASELPAFRRVLLGDPVGGPAGVLVPVGDDERLAAALGDLLDDPGRRAALVARGEQVVEPYDWPVVTDSIERIYDLAMSVASVPGPRSFRSPSRDPGVDRGARRLTRRRVPRP